LTGSAGNLSRRDAEVAQRFVFVSEPILEGAGQTLQPARGGDGAADDAERYGLFAADIDKDGRPVSIL
jgi:hypothetical protein